MINICIIGHGEIGKVIESSLNLNTVSEVYIYDKKTGIFNEDKLALADIIFICTPSSAYHEVLKFIALYHKPNPLVISLSKGIDKESGKFINELMIDYLKHAEIGLLAGPMLAGEIQSGLGSIGIFSAEDVASFQKIQNILLKDKIHLKYSPDMFGVALFSVLKNIYTLIVGMAVGLGYGKNIQGWLIAQSFAEWRTVADELDLKNHDASANLILSDFIATASSPLSQNRTAGIHIAEGKHPHNSEGLASLPILLKRLEFEEGNLPILSAIDQIIYHNKPAKDTIDKLLDY